MPALTFEAAKVDLSYSYDTLTIHPKFKEYDEGPPSLQLTLTACGYLSFVVAPEEIPTAEMKALHKTEGDDIPQLVAPVRYVHHEDDDHDLYHHDAFPIMDRHCHLKFEYELTREQLVQITDIFVSNNILTPVEKEGFLTAFDDRYAASRAQLDRLLGSIPAASTDVDTAKVNTPNTR